jgi:hypothetical protein
MDLFDRLVAPATGRLAQIAPFCRASGFVHSICEHCQQSFPALEEITF